MPRAEGRPRREPLRDPENLLIEYWVTYGKWNEVFKCDCCDAAFDAIGWSLDRDLNRVEPRDSWNRDDVRTHAGARVVDAVRVRGDEDWEYRPGDWAGWACPRCAELIARAWIVVGEGRSDGPE